MRRVLSGCAESLVCTAICTDSSTPNIFTMLEPCGVPPPQPSAGANGSVGPSGVATTTVVPGGEGAETCRFPKLEECAHFHYERVQLPKLDVVVKEDMEISLHSQHVPKLGTCGAPQPSVGANGSVGPSGVATTTVVPGGEGAETCRFPKLEECAHFHYERVQLPKLDVVVKEDMEISLHSQHGLSNNSPDTTYYTLQVTCRDECWLIQRSLDNFAMLDAQLHQCIYDRKVSQLPDLQELKERRESRKRRRCKSEGSSRDENDEENEDSESLESLLSSYLRSLTSITNNSLNCGPCLNWFQLDNRGHRLLVPSEESRSINTPAVAAAYSVRRYVSQARDELSLEVGDMISVIDMASPGESVWWRGKRGFQVGFFPQHCVHIIGDKVPRNMPVPPPVVGYLRSLTSITNNSLNCGPCLNWFQLDNRGHRLLVPSEESRSINTPAVAAAYSVRRYVSQARDELSLEVGDMISVIDMASPGESVWWRGKRGFQVGFFPQHCVHIIGDKVPRNMPVPPPVVGSLAISPIKPVLRKHGKLITFFRSFILNRPSRRRLKQSGILKERVFGCDLGEHLLNSGHEIPMVLKCCAEFIESHGIVDGIYRLSGVTSNIQKLRNAFDEDRIPNLYTDDILQDIHSVASLLKMYFRELPNPLCTYQLYHSFVTAVQGCSASRNKAGDNERLLKMREAVQKLPPPHYRTLEYLMRHLQLISSHGHNTGMTTRNLAIVWAPNLLRCEELEIGGVAALQGVGVQAVVTEFLVCYADMIFSEKVPIEAQNCQLLVEEKRCRPKSLAISTPTKLLTLEEARNKHLLMKDEGNYIEVGGGPKNLPKKYHTVIELPAGSRKRGLSKRSPSGWRSFFSKSRNSSHGNLSKNRDISSPGIIPMDKSVTESDLNDIKRKLRPVKSAESLTSGQSEPAVCEIDVLGPLHCLSKPQGHNRSVSHDSYFDNLQSSQNNSVGSLLDLSEIQLNFELEEMEMRIFSEDESLVSSPKVQKETVTRKTLNRARPDDFSSAANSTNPSPKKQPRVVISPESLSRKRSRLEDQLSDIQYIDCNTPENNIPCLISTTALVHQIDDSDSVGNLNSRLSSPVGIFEGYQPKNKSPRSCDTNRHSLNFEKIDKTSIPKSLTEVDFKNLTPSPGTPNYKPLNETSTTNTTNSPDYDDDSPKNGYENVLTTISITYKSPTRKNSDNIYEDIELNPEQAVIPTTVASLPSQEASQPNLESEGSNSPRLSLETTFDASITTICSDRGSDNTLKEENTLNLGEKEIERPSELQFAPPEDKLDKSFDSTTKSLEFTTIDSLNSSPNTPNNSKKSLISPTEISLTENIPNSTPSSKKSSITSINCQSSEDLSDKTAESLLTESLSASDLNKATDKRKSCDAELLDENAIYQQVKYFRRSIHEINSLLDLGDEPKNVEDLAPKLEEIEAVSNNIDYQNIKITPENENYDSLEAENIHLYENVESKRAPDVPRNRMHENTPKKLNLTSTVIQNVSVCSKCSPESPENKINVKNLTSKFETKDTTPENKPKNSDKYDKEGLPPCLRAKNAKNSIKTRSLDAFETEFGSTNIQRRKSLDDRTSSYINSKILTENSKTSSSTTDIRSDTQNKLETVGTEQKLNRERIEKYKEERRNFWREKYRSESFKEDKDKLLSRLKTKSFNKPKTEDEKKTTKPEDLSLRYKSDRLKTPENLPIKEEPHKKLPLEALSKFESSTKLRKKNSPVLDRKHRPSLKELSDKILDESTDEATILLRGSKEEEFIRHRRGDAESKEEKMERRRHTYDLLRDREYEPEKRVSLDAKSTRKEKCSPSYCIKDMKAIFESKSQQ